MSHVIVARLLRKLAIADQPVAQHLLQLPQLKASIPSLDSKLMQIEDIISSIYFNEVELADEWRERLMFLCTQHTGLAWFDSDSGNYQQHVDVHQNVAQLEEKCVPTSAQQQDRSMSTDPLSSSTSDGEDIITESQPHLKQIAKQGPQNELVKDLQETDLEPSTSHFNGQLSRNDIQLQMEKEFELLPPLTDDNANALKPLLKLITKAYALSMPFWNDRELQLKLFNYAFDKLPPTRRDQFLSEHNFDQTAKELHRLKWFLQRHIINHCRAVFNERGLIERPDHQVDGKFCQYCKKTDHLYEDCWELKGHLCERCFEYGHPTKHCRSDLAKQEISTRLKNILREMTPVQQDRMEHLKQVLVAVVKAQQAIRPFWYDAKLHSLVCSAVLVKLPQSARGQFVSLHGHNAACWSVSELRRFLQDHLKQQLMHKLTLPCEVTKNNDQFCQYCKQVGHLSADCIKRQSVLCFACFEFGHSSKRCTNKKAMH